MIQVLAFNGIEAGAGWTRGSLQSQTRDLNICTGT